MRETLPVVAGVIPFGLVTGVTAVNFGVPPERAFHMSWIIFAGASQLAATQLYAQQAAPLLVIVTAFMINARYMMYGAALAPFFRELSLRWKVLIGYIMVDQSFAFSLARFNREPEMPYKQWYYLGTSVPSWVAWVIASGVGVLLGQTLPPEWGLDFAVPLSFLAVVAPMIKDRPTIAAAIVGGVIATLLVPTRAGVIVGALAGIIAGTFLAAKQNS
jgi:4-azaleucine resistance transporter AzlC